MKNDFDKKIKDLMESANLSDTGFDLNKSTVWNSIEHKQKAKIIPFRKWLSHAVAIIIGILICLPFLFHSNKKMDQNITVTKTISMPGQIIRDTIFVESKQNAIAIQTTKLNTKKSILHTDKTIADKVLQPIVPEVKKEIALQEPVTKIAIAATTTYKPAVLHLMDMDNENAQPNKFKKPAFALIKIINLNNNPDDHPSETVSMMVSKQILHHNR